MTIIPELASQLGRKDEGPNKDLGIKLVTNLDLAGIREAAENLSNPDRKIQVDCLGVLEQVGLLAPELIEDYLDNFLDFAFGKDNRLIWQSLINIAMIADRKANQIMPYQNQLIKVIEGGSVITRDNGIKILARAGGATTEYTERVMPYLFDQLNTCRPKSIPQYAESILPIVNSNNQLDYLAALNKRLPELTPAQEKRVQKIIRKFS